MSSNFPGDKFTWIKKGWVATTGAFFEISIWNLQPSLFLTKTNDSTNFRALFQKTVKKTNNSKKWGLLGRSRILPPGRIYFPKIYIIFSVWWFTCLLINIITQLNVRMRYKNQFSKISNFIVWKSHFVPLSPVSRYMSGRSN